MPEAHERWWRSVILKPCRISAGLNRQAKGGCSSYVNHDGKLHWHGTVCRGRVRSKRGGALAKMCGVLCRELSLWVFVLAFRVLFSVQSETGAQLSAFQLQAGRRVRVRLPLCSSAARRGRLLAPSRPPINRSFSVAPGWFRSQNRHCSWRPGATQAKGG